MSHYQDAQTPLDGHHWCSQYCGARGATTPTTLQHVFVPCFISKPRLRVVCIFICYLHVRLSYKPCHYTYQYGIHIRTHLSHFVMLRFLNANSVLCVNSNGEGGVENRKGWLDRNGKGDDGLTAAAASKVLINWGAIHQLLNIILQLRILVLLFVSTLPYVVKVKRYS
jgi:hypothetical protein